MEFIKKLKLPFKKYTVTKSKTNLTKILLETYCYQITELFSKFDKLGNFTTSLEVADSVILTLGIGQTLNVLPSCTSLYLKSIIEITI